MNKLTSLFALTLLLLVASCTSRSNKASDTTTDPVTQQRQLIEQRISDIFQEARNMPLDEADNAYMSTEYRQLLQRALDKAGDANIGLIQAGDHWTQSQEGSDNTTARVLEIKDLTSSSATAITDLINFPGTDYERIIHLTLQLVAEDGQWLIDNFIQDFEGKTYNEKAALRAYIDSPDPLPLEAPVQTPTCPPANIPDE